MKLLSLHGGGMMGYMTLCYLEQLEKEAGKSIPELFDMIGGVSTGSIIAGGYAAGKTTTELKQLYKDLRKDIFGNKRGFIMSLFLPYYNLDDLSKCLKEVFGECKINEATTKTLIYSVDISGHSPLHTKFWKSWKNDELISDICAASSCAPMYFEPFKNKEFVFIDGGVACNNPSMCLVAEAVKEGANINEIDVVSMWTERIKKYDNPEELKGLLKVGKHIGDFFTASGADMVDYQVDKLIRNLVIVKPDVDLNTDTDKFDVMEMFALSKWQYNGEKVLQIVNRT